MKISIRKKTFIALGLIMSTALLSNQSCDQSNHALIKQDSSVVTDLKKSDTINQNPEITVVEERVTLNQASVAQLAELIADLFEGKNPANANESITSIIQKGQDIIKQNRPTFDANFSELKVDKILAVFEKIKIGILKGYYYNDSTWYGRLPGPRLKEMADLLKEFVNDLPAATRKRLTVGKLQQLAMLQVLIARLARENVIR